MRYLSLAEVLDLHEKITSTSGGATGVRDLGALESAIDQLRATFANEDLYPDVASKAAALCFSIVQNHPFVDGNKRVGHAAMEVFLILNDFELTAAAAEQEAVILKLASGQMGRDDFTRWVKSHVTCTSS